MMGDQRQQTVKQIAANRSPFRLRFSVNFMRSLRPH
jgi:hypothetical protein